MIETVDGIATIVEQLTERVRELERRIAALEGQTVTFSPTVPAVQATTEVVVETPAAALEAATASSVWQGKTPPATWKGFPPVETPAGVFTTAGKAVLGMAGAFLLRAIAESGSVPKVAVVAVAILYAAAWMVWSARVYAKSRFASVTYAVTSALILAPMLWETTVRFHALAPAAAAAVLVGYVVLTLALARQRDLELVSWVATVAACLTALGLIITTHALVPLVVALLAVALASEVSSCTG